MGVITFSSSFGSGGSVVAARVAATLRWDLHNRAIPVQVASRLSLPLEAALRSDEASQTRLGRLLARFSFQLASEAADNFPPENFVDEESFRHQSELIIRNLASNSNCVIVGRASAIVIGNVETALHVRLNGDRDRRVIAAAEALNISIEESTKRLIETDRARGLYVRHFYGRDWADASLYHLVIDSSAVSLETCVDIVLVAAKARFAPIESTFTLAPG